MTTIRHPLKLANGIVLRNRIVKSAMSEALADARGDASDGQIKIYARWGQGGAGMLLTGNAMVDRRHLEHPANFVLDERSDKARTRRL
ncbi:MAG: oxidoreductase, partial [Gammaproteobacteria bacterium]|nr:oxidoreductase [Gammaproteobacteria bacterium]